MAENISEVVASALVIKLRSLKFISISLFNIRRRQDSELQCLLQMVVFKVQCGHRAFSEHVDLVIDEDIAGACLSDSKAVAHGVATEKTGGLGAQELAIIQEIAACASACGDGVITAYAVFHHTIGEAGVQLLVSH